MSRQIFNLRNRLAFLRRRAATEFSRGFQPIGIYTISGFPESHHRQVVDRSIPTYKTLKNPLESHHRQVVDRSIPTFVFRCRARRLDLNDPPPAGGGILGNLPSPCRLGLIDPPAPAGGILLNIICVDTNGFQPTVRLGSISASRQRRLNSIVADATWKYIRAHRGLKPTAKFKTPLCGENRRAKSPKQLTARNNHSHLKAIIGSTFVARRAGR